ncbi:hypothetical protein [Arcanobacterium buesumense]|uniref:Uncharacterized protein n=1 Tax=Arcanobacterium buesumense TaxID=2722751 RepID=A0A6H2EN42_9ACTO|nr:hypothetical protein [Arcanobacterium buesumense]QJC22498.1 hypothetical protein HC352_08285 [Arcanobacterium buesumense]
MKTPNLETLNSLQKAPVNDPIVAGAPMAGTAGNASHASKASNAGTKFTIRLKQSDMGIIRAAYLHDLSSGIFQGSLSAWATHALLGKANAVEKQQGAPLREVNTGVIPRGRLN